MGSCQRNTLKPRIGCFMLESSERSIQDGPPSCFALWRVNSLSMACTWNGILKKHASRLLCRNDINNSQAAHQNIIMKSDRSHIVLIILLVYVFSNCTPTEKPAQTKQTHGQQQSWALDYLNANILYCQRVDDSVSFRTTAKLGIGQWGKSWDQSFILGREGEFLSAPDHHIKVYFRIASIDSAGVHIKYEYRFDHRSFGEDFISIDSGEIQLAYK